MADIPHRQQAAPSPPDAFRPCFVVGNGRSGTTLLTVLLGRHSQLATTPETHFLSLSKPPLRLQNPTHEQLLDQFFGFYRTADLHLERAPLAARFNKHPADYRSLFQAMLEEFAAQHAPGKSRVGEKTPLHLLDVPTLIEWFPHCRIVCILRDGRDVVLSLRSMEWTSDHHLRPLCLEWIRLYHLALAFKAKYPQHFTLIRYEDLLDRPEEILRQVDAFLDLPYEPQQLDPQVAANIVVPDSERGWKSQALKELDPSRKATWKKKATPEELLIMNTLMGEALRQAGYPETEPPPCSAAMLLRAKLGNTLGTFAIRTGLYTAWYKTIGKNLPSARAERRRRRESAASAR